MVVYCYILACLSKSSYRHVGKLNSYVVNVSKRYSNTLSNQVVEKHRRTIPDDRIQNVPMDNVAVRDYRYVFPEFLPNADIMRRDRVSERLERRDMLNRRSIISIPEFYVGSTLAVSVADSYYTSKQNRFVGICIQRTGHGLRANFTLRNVVDGQGVEIRYDLYSPILLKIDVLKLEKRLDDELLYLRDAPPEYSTVPFNFEYVSPSSTDTVPINNVKVKLGPRPWSERWERKNLKGIEDLALPKRFYDRAEHPQIAQPWRKHDLMLKYRQSINDVESEEIMSDVLKQIKKTESTRKMTAKK